MANFVDRVGRAIKKTARKTSKKATEIVNVTKCNVQIKAKDVDLSEKFEELGKLYYESLDNISEEKKALIEKCISQIKEIEAQILALKEQAAKEKGDVKCTSCGSFVSSSKDVCPSCGASLERMEAEAAKPEQNTESDGADGSDNKEE